MSTRLGHDILSAGLLCSGDKFSDRLEHTKNTSRCNFVQVDDDINVWEECDNNSASEKTPAVIFSIYKYCPLWDTHGNRSEISIS